MRNDIVIAFLGLCFIVFVTFVFRFAHRSGSQLIEDLLEKVNRSRFSRRLLINIEYSQREELLDKAMAIALAPLHWPSRRSEDDPGLAQARQRYFTFFQSMSDEEIRQWIREKIGETHSLLLKCALQSLNHIS